MNYTYDRYSAAYSFSYINSSGDRLMLLIEEEFSGNAFKAHAEGLSMTFSFDTELSAGEKTTLDSMVTNYVPVQPTWE